MKRSVVWSVSVLCASLAAVAAYKVLPLQSSEAETPPPRPISVTTGIVEAKDFPIYRVGLGTVQAYNTVTIKVRVDGEVQKIAFREGQDVQVGDLLAQIDPPEAAQFVFPFGVLDSMLRYDSPAGDPVDLADWAQPPASPPKRGLFGLGRAQPPEREVLTGTPSAANTSFVAVSTATSAGEPSRSVALESLPWPCLPICRTNLPSIVNLSSCPSLLPLPASQTKSLSSTKTPCSLSGH